MPGDLLNIHWLYGDEYVPIPAEVVPTIRTVERWNRPGTNVTYTARLEHPDLEHHQFVLRYVRDDQTDPEVLDPDNEVVWGRSEIAWRPAAEPGRRCGSTMTVRQARPRSTSWAGKLPSSISDPPFR